MVGLAYDELDYISCLAVCSNNNVDSMTYATSLRL